MCGNSLKFIIAPQATKVNESSAIYEIIFASLSFFERAYNFKRIIQKVRIATDFHLLFYVTIVVYKNIDIFDKLLVSFFLSASSTKTRSVSLERNGNNAVKSLIFCPCCTAIRTI